MSTPKRPEQSGTREDPKYDVVWPLGKVAAETVQTTESVSDLDEATVAEVWDWVFRGDEMFPVIRDQLSSRFPGIRFVEYETFGDIHGPNQQENIASLPERLRRHGCTAAIVAVGA